MGALRATLRDGAWLTRERIAIAAAAVLLCTVLALGFLALTAKGSVDILGRPLGTDFSSFYAAGKAVLAGTPDAAYDPTLHHARQQGIFGPATPFYGWQYPPFFLVLAAVLALLPYPLALLAWQGGTLALYLVAIGAIAGARLRRDRLWWLLALGFPAVFVNLGHGQNGFLSAGLLGLALVMLDRRPIGASVLLGLMAYKPQLGLMLPLVLLASGRWRTFGAAAATFVAMAIAVTSLLGIDVWRAFLASTAFTRQVLLEGGDPGWEKIQTVFAWVRLWDGGIGIAYAAQAVATLVMAVALIWLWRRPVRFAWQAAALAIAVVAAAPFSLDYDMTILAVAIAYLTADGMQRGFVPWEKTTLAALWLVPIAARSIAGTIHLPIGAITMLAAFAFIIVRAPKAGPRAADAGS
jgi:hypothetical protein